MISRVRGLLVEVTESLAIVEVSGLAYDINVPPYSVAPLLAEVGGEITLFTYHYIVGGNVANAIPTLIGFPSRAEREFFERFITVPGIGPKAAVKALTIGPSDVATAIEREDIRALKSMPGVGERTAREIVATLKGKVSRFAHLEESGSSRANTAATVPVPGASLENEAVAVLEQLGYRTAEAERIVAEVLRRLPDLTTVEHLIQEVYHQGVGGPK